MIAFLYQLLLNRAPCRRYPVLHTPHRKAVTDRPWSISNRRVLNMKMIEVERKFRVSQETKSMLEQLSLSRNFVEFEDCYLSEELALEDMWLRQRNGIWELKVPVTSDRNRRLGATVYRELVGPAVWHELSRVKVEAHGLLPYATIRTERTQLKCLWKTQEVEVVLDVCTSEDGFRYSVGELELLVNRDSEVEGAANTLDQFAKSLNLQAQSDTDGKLLAYLKEKNEALYHAIALKGLT